MFEEFKVLHEFQFYDSPIKSVDTDGIVFSSITFQFYDSPIKSLASSSTNANTFEFQFYDSPIKSEKGRIQAVGWV